MVLSDTDPTASQTFANPLHASDPARIEALPPSPSVAAPDLALDPSAASAPGAILVEAVGAAPIPQLGAADLEAYVDGLVPQAIARGGLAGAVVVVVKDGQLLLSKGYGYADVERRKPMDPARTLLRPGSISKLFTWTAVMQLVERGKLDLDADVNTYLDFKIRDYYGQSITLRHLMTHSAGFEESSKHLFAADPSRLRKLGDYLKAVQPRRIYAPGTVPAYSNYGAALAGYIVERVADQPFDDYVEEHLFEPLRMHRSSFRQPLPKGLAGDMAQSYVAAGAAPVPFELVNPAPAGSLSSTGEDMAHFMLAQLDQGRYGSDAILQPHTLQSMQATALRPIPGLDAMALGFFRRDGRGPVVIGHGGATEAFQSSLMLLPAHRLGVFVSADGPARAGRALHRDLIEGVIQRYYPSPLADLPTLPTAHLHGEQLRGRYENSRGSASNFLAMARLFGGATLVLNDDDTIAVSSLRGSDGRIKRWREIEPYVWREVGGDSRLAAKMSGAEVVAISSDDVPAAMWLQPVPGWRSPGWMLPLLFATLGVQALALCLWPIAAVVRYQTQRRLRLDGRERDLRLLTMFGLIANLSLAGLWWWLLVRAEASVRALDGGLDGWMRLAQLLGLLSVPIAIVACLNARAAWRGPLQRLRRVCAVAIAAACVAMVWFVFALKTMSWSLVY